MSRLFPVASLPPDSAVSASAGAGGCVGGLGDLALGVQWLTIVRFLTNVRSFTLATPPRNRFLQSQRSSRGGLGDLGGELASAFDGIFGNQMFGGEFGGGGKGWPNLGYPFG